MAKANEPFLELVGTVEIPAHKEPFIARDHFVVGRSTGIGHISPRLNNLLLSMNIREEPSDVLVLRFSQLKTKAYDNWIINELGGGKIAITPLFALFYLLQQQAHGEEGPLLVDGKDNVFFITPTCAFTSIGMYHSDALGWTISLADQLINDDIWTEGVRIFSC